MDQVAELARRVARLDERAGNLTQALPLMGFERFLWVMDEITPGAADVSKIDPVSPAMADSIVGRSDLLSELRGIAPDIVEGPLSVDHQYWISTGKPSTVPQSNPQLGERDFVDVSAVVHSDASTKPFSVGLYTSTGLTGTHGMWELYLDTTQSTLFPMPWHIWAVRPRPDAKVWEVSTAAAWADLVCSYPLRHRDLVYPDWQAVSLEYDAIHVTLRAVAALQGTHLQAGAGRILAPSYWGIESTLWLHWCFRQSELVGVRTRDEGVLR